MTTLRSSLDTAARAAAAHRTEEVFRQAGALREGHFLLKSGRHSDRYLEDFQVLQVPAATTELCGMWIADYGAVPGDEVEVVTGQTTVGVILACEMEWHIGTRAI